MMVANVLGQEMVCTEAEALRIATAYVGLRRHYGSLGIDPKTQAIIAMGIVIVSVEAPKVQAMLRRKRAEAEVAKVNAEAERQSGGGTVVPINPGERPGTGFPLHG